jgi:hypothetical protein
VLALILLISSSFCRKVFSASVWPGLGGEGFLALEVLDFGTAGTVGGGPGAIRKRVPFRFLSKKEENSQEKGLNFNLFESPAIF